MANDMAKHPSGNNEEPAGRPGFRPLHPGAILAQAMASAGIVNKAKLAAHLGVSRQSLYELLNGERAVTAEMAARLGRAFGNAPRFWLNLQAAHDTWAAESLPAVRKVMRLPELQSSE